MGPTSQPMPSRCRASEPVAPLLRAVIDAQPQIKGSSHFALVLSFQRAKGLAKYGTELHTFNGRDAMRDFEEEVVDALQYGIQAIMEDPSRAADLLAAAGFLLAQLTKAATIAGRGAP